MTEKEKMMLRKTIWFITGIIGCLVILGNVVWAIQPAHPNTMNLSPKTIARMLAQGHIDSAIYDKLLLLSEENRVVLRHHLRTFITEDEIARRKEVFAIVGLSKGEIQGSADDANDAGRKAASEYGNPDGWQLYISLPTFYSQNDPNWSRYPLGWDRTGQTLGSHGCHVTCIAMLYAYWGYGNMNPPVTNAWGRWNNGFVAGTGNAIAANLIDYPNVNRPVRYISANDIYREVQQGHPVIVHTNQYSGSHFVLIFAFDGARYCVKDPVKDWRNQDQPLGGSQHFSYRVYGY